MTTKKGPRSPNLRNGTMSPDLLIAAGAQAAAQGLVRSALLTKLLPLAGAAALLVRLSGRSGGTDIRPVAAIHNTQAKAARRSSRRVAGVAVPSEGGFAS